MPAHPQIDLLIPLAKHKRAGLDLERQLLCTMLQLIWFRGRQLGVQHPAHTTHLPCTAQPHHDSGAFAEITPTSCMSDPPTHYSPTPLPPCLIHTSSTICSHTKVTEVFGSALQAQPWEEVGGKAAVCKLHSAHTQMFLLRGSNSWDKCRDPGSEPVFHCRQ